MSAGSPLNLSLLPVTSSVGHDGHLRIGGVDVLRLAEDFGTPLFVYDEHHLRDRAREAVEILGPEGAIYATKAFLCRAMARLVAEEGMRLDVATGGELAVVLAAGVPAGRLVLHGNNKADWELRAAIDAGVGRIVVDSGDELDRIEALVSSGLPRPKVLLRINPGIEVHTHEHVRTGNLDSKFGFPVSTGQAHDAVRRLCGRTGSPHAGGVGRGDPAGMRRGWYPSLGGSRAGAGHRRAGSGHSVHGGDDQADPRGAHLCGGGRRHERQPPPCALRVRLRDLPAEGG